MKLAIASLALVFITAQARHWDNGGFGGGQGGGFGGGRGGGFGGGQGGGFGGGRGGGMGGGMGGFGNPCEAPIWFPSFVSNTTIQQIDALWTNWRNMNQTGVNVNLTSTTNNSNCSAILQQQETLLDASFDQYLTAQAANMSSAAQSIFNLFKQANDAFEAATPSVQTELVNFMMRVLSPGGGQGQGGFGMGGQGGQGGMGFSGQGQGGFGFGGRRK